MKIGSHDHPAALNTPATDRKATTGTDRKAGAEAARAGASAQVELSDTAASLLTSEPADGAFDADKVQRIAQAIREGKFQVNPERIADRLLANAKEVLDRTAH